MNKVGIINYGVGNLRSVSNAVQHVGAEPIVTKDPAVLERCSHIIFPGVGAFAYGIKSLKEHRLDHAIRKAANQNTPILAICLGMQLLLESSSEFGNHEGLGIIPGTVDQFKTEETSPQPLRLPNVGWLPIKVSANDNPMANHVLKDTSRSSQFYFVHSFHAQADNPDTKAVSQFGNQTFAAMVARGSVIGTQFHPEKSGPDGLRLLRNFVSWGQA